ncbi:MAG TPA: MFS transporter [Candidatus Angelobacter sp.]|nr:MFS transporter [Candidatus Angelobacter sp.]
MNRNFLFLWQGQVVSQIGTQLFQVIVILSLKQATESATLVGLLMMASTIPALLLGPLGGAVVDRYSRRSVLITGDFIRGLALTGIACVLWFGSHSIVLIVCSLFAYSLLEGSVGAVWQPASMSVVPDLVPKEGLGAANSFIQGSFQICAVLGQAIAGLLFRTVGAPLLMLADAVTYFYAAISDAFIRIPALPTNPAGEQKKQSSFKSEIMEGLRHIHSRPGMKMLFYTMAFFQLVMVPMLILFPFYVEDYLKAGPQWYGFLLAASGFGTFIGYGLGGAVKLSPRSSSRVTVVIMVTMSLCLTALSFVSGPWAALWLIGGVGAMDGFIVLKLITTLQLATPTEIRGRVFGLLMTITRGLTPFAMGLTGIIADMTHRNIPAIYLFCGVAATLLAANVAMKRECRDFLAGEDGSTPVAVSFEPKVAAHPEVSDATLRAPLLCQMDSLETK